MSNDKNTSRHVSYEQVKTIIDFMGQHIEFATGSMRSLDERHTSKRLWGELTKTLNSYGGTKKNSDGWSKYWSDFKNKLKNKVRILERQKSGSALKKTIRPLTKLEKRALVILGPYFDKKRNRKFQFTPVLNQLEKEVKQETLQENNHYEKNHNDIIDRLSEGEKGSEQSGASSEEYVEEVHEVNNEQLIQNLYPKWLIEVEKKRADAELLRAKAEEQRVAVAAKNAEAAVMQAEALSRLSEAAQKQAEAMMRIAIVLENRSCRDLLNI